MAVRFSDEQVAKATGGRRVRIGARASYGAICTDSRKIEPGCLFVALIGEKFDGHEYVLQAAQAGAAGALVQKGRTLPTLPADFAVFEVEDSLRGLGLLARFHRLRFAFPVGAVTGSNGKTTTKEMVAAILSVRGAALRTEGNLNNEVGVPLTLFGLAPQQVGAIIEMGMNHPGEIARLTEIAQPDAGLITVIQPAHLHGLGSIEGVAAAKGELFANLRPGATAVVNLDDARIVEQARSSGARMLSFGRAEGAEVRLVGSEPQGRVGQTVRLVVRGAPCEVRLAFLGAHNAQNAAGAFALALALGWTPEECALGLSRARPYQSRLNLVEAPGGYAVLDDCYNANPSSMAAALDTLSTLVVGGGRAVAVLGDMLELGDAEQAEHRALVAKAGVVAPVLALFGQRTHEALAAAPVPKAASFPEDVEALVAWLRPQLREGDVVLVKGSRGMRLERVVAALTGAADGGGH